MGRGKTILICGAEDALSAAIQMQLEKLGNVEIVSTDQAKERGITLNSASSLSEHINEILIEKITVNDSFKKFTPPLTRRERRAQNRLKK